MKPLPTLSKCFIILCCSLLLHLLHEFTGKTVAFARTVDIPRVVNNFRFFSTSLFHHTTDCSQMDHEGCLSYTIRCPVGVGEISVCWHWNLQILTLCFMWFYIVSLMCVAGLISPWNLPLYLLTWKIAPAIATGNTVVAKPSEMTSVTAWMMCKLMQQAGTTRAQWTLITITMTLCVIKIILIMM